MTTETPRTNALAREERSIPGYPHIREEADTQFRRIIDFSRTLERELTAAQERNAQLHCEWRIQNKCIADLQERNARLVEALSIIAGEKQCIDNLMSNVDIARAVLREHDQLRGAQQRVIGSLAGGDDITPPVAAPHPTAEANQMWEVIDKAPMYVHGQDALVGQYVPGWGWRKVTIWQREWTREDNIRRGATHWWPHLRDLPKPTAEAACTQPPKAASPESERRQSSAQSLSGVFGIIGKSPADSIKDQPVRDTQPSPATHPDGERTGKSGEGRESVSGSAANVGAGVPPGHHLDRSDAVNLASNMLECRSLNWLSHVCSDIGVMTLAKAVLAMDAELKRLYETQQPSVIVPGKFAQ
jgi:hypothetical protein